MLLLCGVAAIATAETRYTKTGNYDRCLRIENERSALRCVLRKQRVQAILAENDRQRQQRSLEYSTPEGRDRAVERLLKAHAARSQRPPD